MAAVLIERSLGPAANHLVALRALLARVRVPFGAGDRVGIKVHWGERGNRSFLDASYVKLLVDWLRDLGAQPFVFDTTVLYSGGRRRGPDALRTAARHGYSEERLGCPVEIADGLDGRAVVSLPAGWRHFDTVQVAEVVRSAAGFVVFSHVKGHLVAGFGGAVKNLSMGFASRAQKQRMHADAGPVLQPRRCNRCGVCVEVCPAGAAQQQPGELPTYALEACVGCAQCIAQCPEVALRIHWQSDPTTFQERLVETAAAVWRLIEARTVVINALLRITAECDCMPGHNPEIASDMGFCAGDDPIAVDAESVRLVGGDAFDGAHPGLPWRHQFEYAARIGFGDGSRP